MIQGETVLVTGGAGSVGRHLVRHLLTLDVDRIRIFDNNESNLSQLRFELEDPRCRYFVGDVRDSSRLDRAFEDVDVVIHTAGLKHVNFSEYNPFEAVKTNVIGLQNVVDAALDADVSRLVFTSSDKAVNPANTMGTTKLLAEKLITSANKYRGPSDIRLASVRFGNVLNSSQSVVPLFKRQIRDGGPITLTDERMVRYFLTWEDVTDLVLSATRHTNGGEIFLRKMPAIRIKDLADVLIDHLAPKYGHGPSSIEIDVVGPRIGETIYEEVMTEREAQRTVETDSLYAILPEEEDGNGFLSHSGIKGFSQSDDIERSSAKADLLEKKEIVSLLEQTNALEISND